jgi:hypothetical protein
MKHIYILFPPFPTPDETTPVLIFQHASREAGRARRRRGWDGQMERGQGVARRYAAHRKTTGSERCLHVHATTVHVCFVCVLCCVLHLSEMCQPLYCSLFSGAGRLWASSGLLGTVSVRVGLGIEAYIRVLFMSWSI